MSVLKDIPEQIEVGERVAEILKEKDVVIIDAPTGWGKTGLAYQIYKAMNCRTLVLNNNNVLVNQYMDLLEENLPDECISCKGATNYECKKDPLKNPATARCAKIACPLFRAKLPGCEYFERRKKMDSFPLVISNYQLVLSLLDVGAKINPYDLVICDECHNIENIIVDYATVSMTEKIVDEITGYNDIVRKRVNSLSNYTKDMLEQKAKELRELVLSTTDLNYKSNFEEFYKEIANIITLLADMSDKDNDHGYQDYLAKLHCKWSNYLNSKDKENFLYDSESKDAHRLVPLNINEFFSGYINSIGNKLVLMSATVINHKNMIKDLGLNPDKVEYIELGSKFDKNCRPIIPLSVARVKITNKDYEQSDDFKILIESIVNLLNTHRSMGESGFIYCNSYKLCSMIYNNIKNRVDYKILMNTNAAETKEVLEKFQNTGIKNRLLISPSFAEGVNFGGDISRFQIIPKVPYLYLGSKRIATKTKLNNRWYTNKTIENIIQASGRSVRFIGDEAVTYILDADFKRCYEKYKEDYPNWFNEAVIWDMNSIK